MRASFAILAALGVTLALAGLGDREVAPAAGGAAPGRGAAAAAGDRTPAADGPLEPNVALRVSAADPERTLPSMLDRVATASASPALARAVGRTSAALTRAGVDPADLLHPFSFLVISLERSCPPPALLACRPAIRVLARLRGEPAPSLRRDLRAAVLAGLGAAGFRRLTLRPAPSGARAGAIAGRVTSRGETLARWRLADGVLEVATAGLGLSGDGRAAVSSTTTGSAVRSATTGSGEADAGRVRVEANPRTLAALLDD